MGTRNRLSLLPLAAAALLACLAAPAWAHAVLVDTEPGEDEVVEGAPDEIVLVFNEPMQPPATIAVTGPDDETVLDEQADIDGEQVRLPLEGLPDDGVYTVSWRAVSADDHLITGEFAFEVLDAAPPEDDPEPTPAAQDTPEPADTPTPDAVPDIAEEPLAAEADDGGFGVLGWLLAGAVVVAALGTTAAMRASRKQPDA